MSIARLVRWSARSLASCLFVTCASLAASVAQAQTPAAEEELKIVYPVDVPSWDPTAVTFPAGQSVYKAVFDSPLFIDGDLKLQPSLIKSWKWADDKNTRLTVELRDDVTFHDGSKLTTEDFKYSFFDRPKKDKKLAINGFFGSLKDIEVASPTEATMVFTTPTPTAPNYLGFLTSYILPKAYIERVGEDAFQANPIGAGPYKIVRYERGSRVILEAYDKYWGPKPAIKRVVFEFVPDASARVAMLESGRADVSVQIPLREVNRLAKNANLTAKIYPYSEIFILQMPSYVEAFQNEHVRRALHMAINKQAISKAFYGNVAKPISVLATPGSPGDVPGYEFKFDKKAAQEELARAGYGPDKPLKIQFLSTNNAFPSDYEMARAIVQMWSQIGVQADLQEITLAKYLELSHSSKVPGVMLYSWANATGDPEIFAGKILDPRLRFSTWKEPALAKTIDDLAALGDPAKRFEGYQALARESTEHAWSLPLLQSVATIAYKKNLDIKVYQTAYILPAEYRWSK
ncbi:ABC transporter substrate-binding protein [Bordetella tumbae]